MIDPYQSYLLQRVEKMTDAERRRIDARTGEIAAAFAWLRRDLAGLLRDTLFSRFSRTDRRTDITAAPPRPRAPAPDCGQPETQPEENRDELTTVSR